MKKKYVVFILLILCLAGLPASNGQKLYRSIDKEYQDVKAICIEAGVVYPAATPLSTDELIYALERIPAELRDTEWHNLYNTLSNEEYMLASEEFSFDITSTINIEVYTHKDDYPREYFTPYKDIPPMLSLFGEVEIADNFYLYLDFIEKDPIQLENKHTPYSNLSTLLDFYDDEWHFMPYKTQAFQPFRAGLSVGFKNFNFQIGRNRQSIGRGIAGNMYVSDNFSMQEYLKFTWYTKYFSYILDLTHFDQQSGEYDFESFRFSGMHQNRVVHTFIVTPLKNLEFTLCLGALFQSDSAMDFRLISPLSIVHSYNNFSANPELKGGDEGNNLLTLEASWTFAPGWIINGQIGMDQIQTGYESGTEYLPNAFGFLLNVQNFTKMGDGHLASYIEAAYTMPYLYMNYKYNLVAGNKVTNYNYDHILGYHLTDGAEIGYTGYPFGPDSIVLMLGANYKAAKWSCGGDLLYWIRGEHGLGTENTTLENYQNDRGSVSPSSEHPQHLIRVTAKGSYSFATMFEVRGSVGFNWIANMNNKGNNNRFDIIGTIGLSFTY